MQHTSTLLQPRTIGAGGSVKKFVESLERIVKRVFGCWHRNMSRPFTSEGQTYRVCLKCGMRRGFDLNNWRDYGPFYSEALGSSQNQQTSKT